MIRTEVRKKLGHLKNFTPLTSFDDYHLDETLVNVKYIAAENYKSYKNCNVENGIFGCKILHPVFIMLEKKAQSEVRLTHNFIKYQKKMKYRKYTMPSVKSKSE